MRAFAIPLDASQGVNKMPEPFPPIDAQSMTDEELTGIIEQCKSVLNRKPSYDWRVIALLKTPAAKAIAAEEKKREEARAALAESARANLEAANAELEKRRNMQAEEEAHAADMQAHIVDIVADLQSRVKDLESAK